MEFYCQFGLKCTADWGGIPVVIMTGDNVQLPPVCDSPPYHCNPSKAKPAAIRGFNIWKLSNNVVTLKQVMRQDNSEVDLKGTLQRLRTYSAIKNDAKWLQKFQWHELQKKYTKVEMEHMSDNALFVYPNTQRRMGT